MDEILSILDDLKERNYLSDTDFAERFIEESIAKKKGLMKIKAELMKRGVNRDIIDSLLAGREEGDSLFNNALTLARKKLNTLRHKNLPQLKLKQRLFSYLHGKGYDSEVINRVINELNLGEE